VCGIFLLKFSTEMLIRTMNRTLTHNDRRYILVADYEAQNYQISNNLNTRTNE